MWSKNNVSFSSSMPEHCCDKKLDGDNNGGPPSSNLCKSPPQVEDSSKCYKKEEKKKKNHLKDEEFELERKIKEEEITVIEDKLLLINGVCGTVTEVEPFPSSLK